MSIQSTTQKTPIVDKRLDAATIKKLWVASLKIIETNPKTFPIHCYGVQTRFSSLTNWCNNVLLNNVYFKFSPPF